MAGSAASVRPFGRAADLDVAFEGVDRPVLVTALLERCSDGADAETWWGEPCSARIATLVRLAAASDGVDTLAARLRCPLPACGIEFEIAVPVDAIDVPSSPDRVDVPLPDGRVAVVRQPTGDDQRRWLQGRYSSHTDAVTAIVESLIVSGDVEPADASSLAVIGTALAELDPLVDFTVSCVCPSCDSPTDVAVDLEGLALARLAAVRRTLLADVHALASAYGWTESEVLAVPPERRLRYRELIAGAMA
jgi:hypothetical protein